MAGLLDIFGTGGTETLSLLGMSPAEIQRNRDDAQAQALYGLAARLFQGGNTGQSIAEGLQQGQKLYSAAMQNQLQDQLQGFQLKDLIEKRKREKQAEERQAMIDRAVAGAYVPAVAAVEPPTPTGPLSGAAFGEVGTPAQEARLDLQSIAPALMATPQGRKTLSELVATQKAMAGDTFNLAEGAQLGRFNPITGKTEILATGAPKREPTPADIQKYNFAKSQGYTGSLMDFEIALKKAGAGTTQNIVYPAGALTPDKGTAKDLQTALLESGSRLSMYNQIESQFKPEYLQPKFKAGQTWSAIKEKSGANLAPADKQQLAEFSQFKQNTLNNLSQTIKALTGASMGVQEAARIEAGLPSAGQGIFDGDSPTEFQAKLNNTMRELRLVEARNTYMLRKGLSFKDIPLDNVPKLINDRAAELAKQYQVDLKKATPTQMNAIKRQLSVEFGITAD